MPPKAAKKRKQPASTVPEGSVSSSSEEEAHVRPASVGPAAKRGKPPKKRKQPASTVQEGSGSSSSEEEPDVGPTWVGPAAKRVKAAHAKSHRDPAPPAKASSSAQSSSQGKSKSSKAKATTPSSKSHSSSSAGPFKMAQSSKATFSSTPTPASRPASAPVPEFDTGDFFQSHDGQRVVFSKDVGQQPNFQDLQTVLHPLPGRFPMLFYGGPQSTEPLLLMMDNKWCVVGGMLCVWGKNVDDVQKSRSATQPPNKHAMLHPHSAHHRLPCLC